MGAAVDEGGTRFAECIQCRTCVAACPEDIITFPASPQPLPAGQSSRPDLSRRGFLYSVAGGVGLGFVVQQSPFTPLQNKQQLIRPPGALPKSEFLTTCIRCGECMKSCLTNTLQPSLWEGGLAGLWTPKLDLRFAACEQECNVCGKVCPTQAIRSLDLEEKTHAKLGTAVLRKEMCLVWAQDKLCLICDEICPYDAIVFRTIEGYRRPVVVASRCNGCGYCEQRCPVEGESAIVVAPIGQIRLRTGSYVAEAKKLQLDFKANPGDDQFILKNEGLRVEPEETRTRAEREAARRSARRREAQGIPCPSDLAENRPILSAANDRRARPMEKKMAMGRRDFLKTTATGLGGFAYLSANLTRPPDAPDKFEGTRVLGRTGIRVPIVSMGVMNTDNPQLVRAALDAGYVFLDTAQGYQRGTNEAMMGEILKDRPRRLVLDRHQGQPPQGPDHRWLRTGRNGRGVHQED